MSGPNATGFPDPRPSPRIKLPVAEGIAMDAARLDLDLEALSAHADEWARLAIPEKILVLQSVSYVCHG